MALVFCTKDTGIFEDQIAIWSALVNEGMRKVVQSITQKSLLESIVLVPMELASLISFQLLQDVRGSFPDICETYWEYLIALVSPSIRRLCK